MQRSTYRITSACTYCKRRRVKCDGARPRCSRCEDSSRDCIYDNVDHRKSRHSHAEFQALQNRVAYLEQQVQMLRGQNGSDSPTQPGLGTDAVSQQEDTILSFADVDSVDDWILELPPLPWDTDKVSQVRSMLARKGSQIQHDQQSGRTRYVGPTSNHHLVSGAGSGHGSKGAIALSDISASDSTCFPPFTAAELHLHNVFKEKAHSTFPLFYSGSCVDEDTVIRESESHGILRYVILAVACCLCDEEDPSAWGASRERLIDNYNSQFTVQAGHELENCCLDNVKAFLLKAYLDVLRGKLESATVFNSVACAMAKRLGLHVDCRTHPEEFDELSLGHKDRILTFWACLWMDRRLAVLEGRGCQIDHIDISCPRPLSIHQGRPNFLRLPLSLELINSCFVEFMCIQDIALNRLYRFSDDIPKDDAISNGHMQFLSWFASLPTSIKDVAAGRSFHPSFLAFHLSFHTGLILLHRRSLDDSGKAAELSDRRCKESASTITTLLKHYCQHYPTTLADPMILHAAFTSALVHLSLLLQPDIVTYRSSLKALRTTRQILHGYTEIFSSAATILADLQALAVRWDISPANTPTFWRSRNTDDFDFTSEHDA
ncbi:hypothetical protein BDV19DRAFT_391418 [Aspergillus venezuelensis]